jgi:hypothetical protein
LNGIRSKRWIVGSKGFAVFQAGQNRHGDEGRNRDGDAKPACFRVCVQRQCGDSYGRHDTCQDEQQQTSSTVRALL